MAFQELTSDNLSISINELGAELSSVRDRAGRELLWQGGPEWQRQAPVLFPIVGRLPGDELLSGVQRYPMTQHGFARDQLFQARPDGDSSCTFSLSDSAATRSQFPFAFGLDIRFTLDGGRLDVEHRVTNPGESTLHASLGAHPGFQWPLPGAPSGAEHTVEFGGAEPAPIRRIEDGLLLPQRFPTPIVDGMLTLDDALFADDAMIFDQLNSRSVRYTAPGAPAITLAFPDFPLLGVWSKPPGKFVCIEPWFGMTSPLDFAGDFSEKPGQFAVQPGESRAFRYSITVSQ